jgi:hypothetical protein
MGARETGGGEASLFASGTAGSCESGTLNGGAESVFVDEEACGAGVSVAVATPTLELEADAEEVALAAAAARAACADRAGAGFK